MALTERQLCILKRKGSLIYKLIRKEYITKQDILYVDIAYFTYNNYDISDIRFIISKMKSELKQMNKILVEELFTKIIKLSDLSNNRKFFERFVNRILDKKDVFQILNNIFITIASYEFLLPNFEINYVDPIFNNTGLHLCVLNNRKEALFKLLENPNINLFIRNKNNLNPYELVLKCIEENNNTSNLYKSELISIKEKLEEHMISTCFIYTR